MEQYLQKLYHNLQGNSPCQSAFEYPCKMNNNKKSFQNMLANTFTMNWWLEREIQIQKLLDYEQSLSLFSDLGRVGGHVRPSEK